MTQRLRTVDKGRPEGLELKVTTAPTGEPVTLSEVKNYLKIGYDDDDTLIEDDIIPSCRQSVESYLGRSLMTQTITAQWTKYGVKMYLPRPPIVSVSSVQTILYDDTDDLTVDEDYYLQGLDDKFIEFGTIDNLRMLKVVYVAGYGDADDVPKDIKIGLFKVIADRYENRQESEQPTIPNDARSILNRYKIYSI